MGKLLLKFRQSRYFRPFYLVVLGILVTGLFQFTGGTQVLVCLGTILIAISVLIIPYWLGERSLKNFAVNALPVFLIAILLIAAFQTDAVMNQPVVTLTTGIDPATSNADLPHLSMWNGSVAPYRGGAGQLYTFRVRLKEVNATGAVVPPTTANITTFSVNITLYNPFPADTQTVVPMKRDPSMTNQSNGTWYVANTTLGDGIYSFYFWANDAHGNYTYAAAPVLEPLIAAPVAFYGFWVVNVSLYLIFPISFYFIMVFMYWYTARMRGMRERAMERARGEKLDLEKGAAKDAGEGETAEKKEGAAAEEASAAKTKKAAAFTCTNCGADVTEDDAKCPKCGAVFED